MNKYGKRIRALREKHGYTLEEAAKKLNMTWSSLGKYERGERKIPPELLEEIARFYEVPFSSFFGEEGEVPEELKKAGVEWVTFVEEMEEKKITPEEIKAILEIVKKYKGSDN